MKSKRGEPWLVDEMGRCIYRAGKSQFVGACLHSDAAHIVAAVNAVDGMDPAKLGALVEAVEVYRKVCSAPYDPKKTADDVLIEKRDARVAMFRALDESKLPD